MSTGHLPQAISHRFLADGLDTDGCHVEGNVVAVAPITVTDPADLPLGGPAEPGQWTIALWVEDPGGRPVRYIDDRDDDEPLILDPPEIVEDPTDPPVAPGRVLLVAA